MNFSKLNNEFHTDHVIVNSITVRARIVMNMDSAFRKDFGAIDLSETSQPRGVDRIIVEKGERTTAHGHQWLGENGWHDRDEPASS